MNKFIFVLLIFTMTLTISADTATGENTWIIVNSFGKDTFSSGPNGIPVGKLTNGTKVTALEATDYFLHVKFPDGQTGWVDRYYLKKAEPGTKNGESKIPHYNTRKKVYYRKDKLENRVLGKNKKELLNQFGPPGARIINKDKSETWYYNDVAMVDGATRYKFVKIQIQNDKATSLKPEGYGSTRWVEKLPLAYTIRGMSFLNITEPDFLGFKKNLPWIFKFLFGLMMICLALIFFSLPGIGAFKLSFTFQDMKQLTNTQVKLAGFIVMFGINYLYFLFLTLHMVRNNDDFIAIVILILFISTYRYYHTDTIYHRCPKCHTMRKVADMGTRELRRKFITKQKSSETESRAYDGIKRIITITTRYWNEHYTRIFYEDLRECTVCRHAWTIPYSITIPGHIPKTKENSPPKESLNPRRNSYVKKFKILYSKVKALYKRFFGAKK